MPPKTADPVDPVDEIVTNADISTVIIKHGASNKEIIMKYVIKRLIRQIQIYWNRVCEKEIEVDILALLTEKFVSSRSIPEFLQAQAHFNGELPATMGHSNRQRPDGVIQFKYKNELCHLFIEIDADDKRHKRQREALKIWQDVSCSIEGQSSNTSPGESISACVMRINTYSIHCSGVKHESVAKASASTEATVPDVIEMETDAVIGDEDKKLRQTYSTKHIDEVKQVFVTMHIAFARQISRVILAWLEHVFEPQKNISKSSIDRWIKQDHPTNRQDFCFWIGEYQITENLTEIHTADLNSKDVENSQTLSETWYNIFKNQEFNNCPPDDAIAAWTDLKILKDDDKNTIELEKTEDVCKRFYDPLLCWKQTDKLKKLNENAVRSQGHWFNQMQTFRLLSNDDNKEHMSEWIDLDQFPLMDVGTRVKKTQGSHGEKTTIKFTNTRKDKCGFEIDIGLVGIIIPRVSDADLETALQNVYEEMWKDHYDALPNFKYDLDFKVEKRTLFDIWQSFENAEKQRKQVVEYFKSYNDNPANINASQTKKLQKYKQWVTEQTRYFTDVKTNLCKNFKELKGMWYSKHIAMICERILMETDPHHREFMAHVLFENSRYDDFLDVEQPNALPLAHFWPTDKPCKWNIKTLKENDGGVLVPLLWDPLSGMLINAILFFIRGIQQSSPLGEKGFQTNRTQVRNTAYVYRSIKALLEADAILPDLLANHAHDRISSSSKNLNTLMLKSICDKELNREFDDSLREYLKKLNSEHCVAFCKLIKCTDDSMLHWTAKMYQNEAFKDEISRNIRLFPIAGQAMILRMLAEAADDNSVVWKTNNEVQAVLHTETNDDSGDGGGNSSDEDDDESGGGGGIDPAQSLEDFFSEQLLKGHTLWMRLNNRKNVQKVVNLTSQNLSKIAFDHNTAQFYCWGKKSALKILSADETKTETDEYGNEKSLVHEFQIDKEHYAKHTQKNKKDEIKKTQFGTFPSNRIFPLKWWFQNDNPADKEPDEHSQKSDSD